MAASHIHSVASTSPSSQVPVTGFTKNAADNVNFYSRPFLLGLKAQSGSHNHYSLSFDEHSVVATTALLSVDIVRLDVVYSSRVRFVRSTEVYFDVFSLFAISRIDTFPVISEN